MFANFTGEQLVAERETEKRLILRRIPDACLYFIGFCFFIAIYLKNAWVAEDGYIYFRTIEQLFAGNGPVWNPHERVQVFTSPLWYALLCFIRIFFTNLYLNSIAISLLLCIATLYVLKRLINDATRWLCVVFLLVSSKALFDYTSSGLENPLGYFLLIILLFLLKQFKENEGASQGNDRIFAMLMLCFGLLLVCRHDLLTLTLPVILMVWWQRRHLSARSVYLPMLAGVSPFIAWSIFSLVYYGFPFPNTAYAKLHTGISRGELWKQGVNYFISSLQNDPVTVVIITVAVIALAAAPNRYSVAVAAGVLLNLIYVVNVGGDFMQGRFLSYSFIFAVAAVFAICRFNRKTAPAVMAVCALYWIMFSLNPVATPRDYNHGIIDRYGVADERGYYFPSVSIWSYIGRDPNLPFPNHPWSKKGLALKTSDQPLAYFGNIGFYGYWAGIDKIIIDYYALSEPFLARLPAERPWRIGHFSREIPYGYAGSLLTGYNMINDPGLRLLYEDIAIITRGPLWSKNRLLAIMRMNTPFGS
jgi:arabinofuranosyltransferase